jgi:hypothetical protein
MASVLVLTILLAPLGRLGYLLMRAVPPEAPGGPAGLSATRAIHLVQPSDSGRR